MIYKSIFIFAAIALSSNAARATVSPQMVSNDFWKFTISGTIDQSDAKRFENIEKAFDLHKKQYKKKPAIIIYLNTGGGDVHSSMSIGRVLRKIDSLVHVDEGAMCASSCVFILAGAGRRYVDPSAKIGIHRPFRATAEKTTPELEKQKYSMLASSVEKYLDSMNVSKRLFEDMMRVSPSDVKFLSQDELVAYGLWGDDPYIEEADAMRKASDIGISRKELAAREAIAFAACQGADSDVPAVVLKYLECKEKIILHGKQ